ncbi:diaminopimelate decarboxylase [Sinosporangium album]|uniref:Diaminopimelate decarboxylase n=1 Tax=Sinosporangium album TaxID=504805 RepID=A0A1G8A652_9ACTN|nr:type III PLP-dependent enzyme [Sinosporangium album]SDH16419.1 diaminopimelate decarboxylase [Sinosporangium album]
MTFGSEASDVDFGKLAATFGTPLYVYDADALTWQYQGLRESLHPSLEIFFSLKSNPNVSVCAVLHALGARAEVSSLTELLTALRAGVDPDNIIFLGPGKSRAEISACLAEGVHAIVCESFGELGRINEMALDRGQVARVALRVNPAFAVKGSRLTMGGRPRQFGIDEAELLARPDLGEEYPGVRLTGIHVYMGTRILDENVVVENTRRILDLAERLSARIGFPLEMVDIGGGLGVAYFDGERDLDVRALTEQLNPVIEKFHAAHPNTRMIMELGRYLSAPAGVYLAQVLYTKESMGEHFAITDGGTHHHMAAVGTGSFVKRNFPIRLLNRPTTDATEPWQVTGPLCTPNDTLGKNVPLPALRPGDLIGVLRSGAYGPTASPVQFLSHGYPAEVLIWEGSAHLVRERDRPEDLLGRQRLHPALSPEAGGRAMASDVRPAPA